MTDDPNVITTANTAMFAWRTDKESNSLVSLAPDSQFDINADNPYLQTIGNPNEKTNEHLVTIYDLEPETLYHYKISSKAEIGPMASSDDFTFITKAKILEITNHHSQVISNEEASFKWITNLETNSQLKYIPYRGNKLMVEEAKTKFNSDVSFLHEITIDDFEAGVVYDIELSGTDLNNRLISKAIPNFSTSGDDLPPIIYNIKTESAISMGKNMKIQTIISWMTNEPSTSRVHYAEGISTKNDFPYHTALNKNFDKKHALVITKFKPGTVYRFKAESMDSGGNISLSKTFTLLTPIPQESIFQIILNNFEKTFSWIGKIKQ